MKFLKYFQFFKENINFFSLLVGLGFIIGGHNELGEIIIQKGGSQ